MSALLSLYLDSSCRGFVFSEKNSNPFRIGTIYQEDTLDIEFTLLKRISQLRQPIFERINLAGHSLVVAIGTAGNALTSLSSWDPSSDGTKLSGKINLATSGMNALADGAQVKFEAIVSKSGVPAYRGQDDVTFKKSVYLSGAVQPITNDVALGELKAARLYVKRDGGPGEGRILRSPSNTRAVFEYLGDDGTIYTDPIS